MRYDYETIERLRRTLVGKDLEEFEYHLKEGELSNLSETLRIAKIRCLPLQILISRIERIWEDDEAENIIRRVNEIQLSREDERNLV